MTGRGRRADAGRVVHQVWTHRAMPAVLLVLLVLTSLGWALDLRPLATVWGSVADWVAGLATAGALLFAAEQIRLTRQQRTDEERAHKESEAERRESQARAVSISSSWSPEREDVLQWELSNGADYAVDDVAVLIQVEEPEPEADTYAGAHALKRFGLHHHARRSSGSPLPERIRVTRCRSNGSPSSASCSRSSTSSSPTHGARRGCEVLAASSGSTSPSHSAEHGRQSVNRAARAP